MKTAATPLPRKAYISREARWKAVMAKDAGADGQFFFAVKTTGIFCRPSCPSRPARRENVVFFDRAADAEIAGFRPCKRCAPAGGGIDEAHAAIVAKACRILESSERTPALADLARQVGMSPFHFHRTFRAHTGLTPKAYAAGLRADRVRASLRRNATVTQAIYDAGFGSNGRFYAKDGHQLGMAPEAYLRGGAGSEIRFAVRPCSLGKLLVAASGKGVCWISLGDDAALLERELRMRFPRAACVDSDEEFDRLVSAVAKLVDAPGSIAENLPLDVRGTVFQQRVWKTLAEIPPGATMTYTELAARAGSPRAVRAAASACASNVLAVAIPCHRAVRADGSLSGYRWGIARKAALLEREAAVRGGR